MDFLLTTLFWSLYFLAFLSIVASLSMPGSLPVLRQGCQSPISLVSISQSPPTTAPDIQAHACSGLWDILATFSKRSWMRQSRELRSQKTSVC